jgi:hypothetical protein
MLKKKYPSSPLDIEVLNFGGAGLSTVHEVSLLKSYMDMVAPDFIIIGFCYNDVMLPKSARLLKRKKFEQQFKCYKDILQMKTTLIHLNHVGDLLVKLVDKVGGEWSDIPNDLEYLKMNSEQNGDEWLSFLRALARIKKQADARKLPTPILAILDHFPWIRRYGDLDFPSNEAKLLNKFFKRVRRAGLEKGLDVINFEPEVYSLLRKRKLLFDDIFLNELDPHPSKRLNEIYARKIVQRLSLKVENRFVPAIKP